MRTLLEKYFSTAWLNRSRSFDQYQHSGWAILDKINPESDRVLDVGCGTNPFKTKIKNLWGIDITDVGADQVVAIEDYYTDEQYDVALCLGSINFGNEDYINKQVAAVSRCVHPTTGRVFWRCNPGLADHGNDECLNIEFFTWSKECLEHFANAYCFDMVDFQHDSKNRLYAEWRRKSVA